MNDIKAYAGRAILLGRLGENEHTRVAFDVGNWLEQYPSATISITNLRPGDADAYPVFVGNTEQANGIVYWTITNTELSAEGNGQCQLTATENNVVVKSIIFDTMIGPALGDNGEVPEPWKNWQQEFADMADEAKTAAEEAGIASTQAVTAATNAGQSANEAANSATTAGTAKIDAENAADRAEEAARSIGDLAEDAEAWAVGQRDGIDVGETDPAYHNNAKYYAESSGDSATTATTQANIAVTAKNTAVQKAEEASASAAEIKELTPEAVTLPPGSSATAEYDALTGILTLGIPEGIPGSGVDVHICSAAEYNAETGMPTIRNPEANTFYLVPVTNGSIGNMFVEWIYTNNTWERFGVAGADLDGVVKTTDYAEDHGSAGIVRINDTYGIYLPYGKTMPIAIRTADGNAIKAGTESYRPIVPNNQHVSAFYGLAKAAGDTTQTSSNRAVGQYTDAAKTAINKMLEQVVRVVSVVPVITGVGGTRYICGEVTTIDIIPPADGIIDVIFQSGSTPTVLTVPSTVRWPSWFDPTALEANVTYEINILDGVYGAVGVWT